MERRIININTIFRISDKYYYIVALLSTAEQRETTNTKTKTKYQ